MIRAADSRPRCRGYDPFAAARLVTRRGGLGTAVVLSLALVTLACGRASAPVTLRVGLLGTTDDLPYHVMQAQGLDRRHGLRLELSTWPGGAQIIEALAAGKLDVSSSVGTVPVLTAAVNGVVPDTVVVVAGNNVADPDHQSVAILVGSDIRGWADLAGGFIGVHNPNSLAGAAAIARLRQEGVTGHRFTTIALPNLGLAVAGRSVAAAAMNEPFATQAVLRGDGRLLAWVIGGPPFERMVFTVTVVRTELYRRQKEVIRALLRAFLGAVAWIDAHPGESRAMIAARLGITDELGQKIAMLRWPLDGRVDRRLLVEQQAVLREAGVLSRVVPADQVVDETALDEVLRER